MRPVFLSLDPTKSAMNLYLINYTDNDGGNFDLFVTASTPKDALPYWVNHYWGNEPENQKPRLSDPTSSVPDWTEDWVKIYLVRREEFPCIANPGSISWSDLEVCFAEVFWEMIL